MKTILKTICVILACATFFTACANIIEDQIPSNTGNNAGSSSVNETDNTVVTTSADVPDVSSTDKYIDEKIWKDLEIIERVNVHIILREPERLPEDTIEDAIEKLKRGEDPIIYDLKTLLINSAVDASEYMQQLRAAQLKTTKNLYNSYSSEIIKNANLSVIVYAFDNSAEILARISYDEAVALSKMKEVKRINYQFVLQRSIVDDPDVPFYQTDRYKELFNEAPDYCWYGFKNWEDGWIDSDSPAYYATGMKPGEMIWYRVDAENVYINPSDTVYGLNCMIGIKDKWLWALEEGMSDEWIRFATPEEVEYELENMEKHGFTVLNIYVGEPQQTDMGTSEFKEVPGHNKVLVLATLDTLQSYVPTSDKVFLAFENGCLDFDGKGYYPDFIYAYENYCHAKENGTLLK